MTDEGTPAVPPKKRVDLPDHVRAAVLTDIGLTYRRALEADEDSKIRLFLATEQGLDTYEIAQELGISQTSASKYARQGKEILARREEERRARESGDQPAGEDPVRQGEPVPLG
jgi:DNA-directed RNA polymerase specialized sigma24 family protein